MNEWVRVWALSKHRRDGGKTTDESTLLVRLKRDEVPSCDFRLSPMLAKAVVRAITEALDDLATLPRELPGGAEVVLEAVGPARKGGTE